MARYTLRVYEPDGSFAFGATLNCRDDAAAMRKFGSMPFDGRRAELTSGKRLLAVHVGAAAPVESIFEAARPLKRRPLPTTVSFGKEGVPLERLAHGRTQSAPSGQRGG
jgi:hypothetical protein